MLALAGSRRAGLAGLAVVAALVASAAVPADAWAWVGTIKLGGIVLDEEGDLSTVQETYNIHDGFSISQLRFSGSLNPDHYLMLDLREINLDGRQADFLYRRPGKFRLNASFDQHRQVFDPDRGVTSERKDWNFGVRVTPARWLRVSGHFNHQTREGSRLSFPPLRDSSGPLGSSEALSELGTGYDYTINGGDVGVELRKDRRGFAVKYRLTDFSDGRNPDADRTGQVVSARAFGPCLFYDKLTHLVRAAYGVTKLSDSDVEHTLARFQYTGVVRPIGFLELKYNFDAQRIDDDATDLKTDRFENVVDATYYYPYGSVSAGYGYETNDDDRTLTSYHSWRGGATFHNDFIRAKAGYAGRIKKDDEDLTLLKDVEASLFRGDVTVTPVDGLDVGAAFNRREREFPDIDVESEGLSARGSAGFTYDGWGRLSATHTYTKDKYTDLAGNYDVFSNVTTARADFERIKDLRLSSGVTYLWVRDDLDIEKSVLFFEGRYTVHDDLHLEVKYNVYNYDDFVLLDRYYTANVVWFNVAYDLHGE